MAITALPTPPSRADAANFAARGDAFLGALPTFVTEANATASAVNASATAAAAAAATAIASPATSASSTDSLTIGTGALTAATQSGKTFVPDMWVAFMHHADPTIWMSGYVVSYSGTSLQVSIQNTSGSGTFADWTIYAIQPSMSSLSPRALAAGSTVKDTQSTPVDQLIGFRGMPKKSIGSGTYTVTVADVGFCLELKSGANIVLPRNSILTSPNQFSASAATIVLRDVAGATHSISPAASTTLYDGSTGNTGSRTLKSRGQAVVDLSGELADTWYALGALS